MNQLDMFYTSRSAIECYQECPRRRWWNYLYDGTGIVPIRKAVPLVTGGAVHVGAEALLKGIELEQSIRFAANEYTIEIGRYKDRLSRELNANEEYVYEEQIALSEALVRLFAMAILPGLLQQYNVLDVEREESRYLGRGVMLEGRIDAVLEDKQDKNILVLNLKTSRTVGEDDSRVEDQTRVDMQGLTEMWLLQKRYNEVNEKIDNISNLCRSLTTGTMPHIERASNKIIDYFKRNQLPPKVSGVKTIFLIKGKQYEQNDGRKETYSPLIRPYRKLVGGEWKYEPSYTFEKPDGSKGRLGKGWEPFHAWECEDVGFVKGWMERLAGMPNVIEKQYYIPTDMYRNSDEVDSLIEEISSQEEWVRKCIVDCIGNGSSKAGTTFLNEYFPMHRRSCVYPLKCQYWDCCYKPMTKEDPLATGDFVKRTPHHPLEKAQLEGLLGSEMAASSTNEEEING